MDKVEKKKWVDKSMILLLVLAFIILATNVPKIQKSFNSTLKGTYHSKQLPFVTIVFDEEDHHSFYYYNRNETDKGTYLQETDKTYVINSPKFQNLKIFYNEKSRTFKINIDNETYVFKQTDSVPTIINNSND
ncbi:hypothetical protein AB1282_20090 [Gottfriedia sp. S16(2024)]|uniref:hypothetical protein n=1 Tax=Gottfriedia sp. S16(2024) TaxID=3162883 RepID=UPI003D1DAC73